MRLWMPLVLLVLAGGMARAYFLTSDDSDTFPSLDEHLEAEAARLATDPDAIEQEDAKWIARRLGDDPSAGRLKELFRQRIEHVAKQYAKRIEDDYPQYYDYTARRAKSLTGTNGYRQLENAEDTAAKLVRDPSYESWLSGRELDFTRMEREHRDEFLQASRTVLDELRNAAAADHIALVAPAMESHDDALDLPSTLDSVRVMVARAVVHAVNGDVDTCVNEMRLLFEVVSRTRLDAHVAGDIMQVRAHDLLARRIIEQLAPLQAIDTPALREWLTCGLALQVDVVNGYAVNHADFLRVAGSDPQAWTDRHLELKRGNNVVTVEEFFADYHRTARNWMPFLDLAIKEDRPAVHTPEFLRTLREIQDGMGGWQVAGNFLHAAQAHWVWAALELRILEREVGSLQEHEAHVVELLEKWTALREEWTDDALELWVRHEGMPWPEQTEPLISLPFRKE